MRFPRLRLLCASLVVLVLASCGSSERDPYGSPPSSGGGGSSSTTTAAPDGTIIEIMVAGGEVTGGVERTEVELGDTVTVRVTSDVAEELHIHGYDLKADLSPGVPAEVSFTADIPGVFDVELEQSGLAVAGLQVG